MSAGPPDAAADVFDQRCAAEAATDGRSIRRRTYSAAGRKPTLEAPRHIKRLSHTR